MHEELDQNRYHGIYIYVVRGWMSLFPWQILASALFLFCSYFFAIAQPRCSYKVCSYKKKRVSP